MNHFNQFSVFWGLAALAMPVAAVYGSDIDADVRAARQQAAQELVQTALHFELEGDLQYRDLALKRALQQAPDYAPAHYHLGRVNVGGQWVSIAESQQQARSDEQLREYRQMRDARSHDSEQELKLARWCASNDLHDVARAHWLRLLRRSDLNPAIKREALRELNLRQVGEALVDDEALADRKREIRQRKAAIDKWRPRLQHWREGVLNDARKKREHALKAMRSVQDPEIIPAVDAFAGERDATFAGELVDLLGRIDAPESSWALVQFVERSPDMTVIDRVIDQLVERPLHEFVPLLLVRLGGMIEVDYHIAIDPRLGTRYQRRFFQEGVFEDRAINSDHTELIGHAAARNPRRAAQLAQDRADRLLNQNEQRLAQENFAIGLANDRRYQVLEAVTGQIRPRTVEAWRQWWFDYNGSEASPKYTREANHRSAAMAPFVRHSCFPAGCPVWTETGQAAIETIKPGDRVLTQHTETGELRYQTVLRTTVREADDILELAIDGKLLAVSSGHPFWVAGAGWRMAKLLKPGDQLHVAGGAAHVDTIEKVERTEYVYNLVVDEFHNYFVGEKGALVHDVTYRRPTRALLPGLLPESSNHPAAE